MQQAFSFENLVAELKPCCKGTLTQHVTHNPMLVCTACRMLLKCFTEENSFRNYVRFCASRKRTFTLAQYESYSIIALENATPKVS